MNVADSEALGVSVTPRLLGSINFIAAIILLVCTGCAQIAYDTLQNSQSMNCHEMQSTADRDECWKRSDMSYDKYQHELNKQKQDR